MAEGLGCELHQLVLLGLPEGVWFWRFVALASLLLAPIGLQPRARTGADEGGAQHSTRAEPGRLRALAALLLPQGAAHDTAGLAVAVVVALVVGFVVALVGAFAAAS